MDIDDINDDISHSATSGYTIYMYYVCIQSSMYYTNKNSSSLRCFDTCLTIDEWILTISLIVVNQLQVDTQTINQSGYTNTYTINVLYDLKVHLTSLF